MILGMEFCPSRKNHSHERPENRDISGMML